MVGGQPDTMLAVLKNRRKKLLFLPAKMNSRGITVSSCISRPDTAKNGSNFAFVRLVVYFPDMLIYLAETAVIFDVYSEISSEQANRIKLSPWLKELQRKE